MSNPIRTETPAQPQPSLVHPDADSLDNWDVCGICKEPLESPGRGRWKYHAGNCEAEARRRNAQVDSANYRDKLRQLLGVERSRIFNTLAKWLRGHDDIRSKYLLDGVHPFLVAAFVDEAPTTRCEYEHWIEQQLRTYWIRARAGLERDAAE